MKDDFRPSAAQPNPTEDRDDSDLISLIESYKKEIWEWKQKESQWLRDKNQLEGNKRIIEELSSKIVQLGKGEPSLAKVMNSPEMDMAKARVKRLDDSLATALEINESHQRYNGKLQLRVAEVEKDNKILSKQLSEYIKYLEDKFRKAGL